MKTIALSPSAGASARINPEASESYALRASRSGIDRSLPDGDRDAGQARSANQALDDRKPEETEEKNKQAAGIEKKKPKVGKATRWPRKMPVCARTHRQAPVFHRRLSGSRRVGFGGGCRVSNWETRPAPVERVQNGRRDPSAN